MMSADPTIPDPLNGQSFNRYSYVNNGPLSATDPSGYEDVRRQPKYPYDCNSGTLCGGSRLPGGDFSADTNAAALLSADSSGVLVDFALRAYGAPAAGTNRDTGTTTRSDEIDVYDVTDGQNTFESSNTGTFTYQDTNGVPVILPNGNYVSDPNSWTGLLMSPTSDLSPVARAGYATRQIVNTEAALGYTPLAVVTLTASLGINVGQGGVFDYQRQGNLITGFQQFPQFRDVSNFNVGLFSQQTGLSLDQTLTISGDFASMFSSNYMSDQPYGLSPRTYSFIVQGYQTGQSGVYGH
jgi:hypothetical protein